MEYQQMRDPVYEEAKFNLAKRRIILIDEELDRQVINKTKYWIERLVYLDEKNDISPKDAEPITIRIDSYGGEADATMHLVSYIESLKSKGYKIITEACGAAMSGGFKLLIVGTERRAHKYADIMVHQPNAYKRGSYTYRDTQIDYEQTKELWSMLKDFICANTKITHEQLDKYVSENRNWHMRPQEAIELGVIDYIIE